MRIFLIIIFVFSVFANSAEVRFGKSQFNWKMGIESFMQCDIGLDTKTLSIVNSHDNFGDSRYYFFYNADLYKSSYMDKLTTMVTYPVTYTWPVVGSINDLIDKHTSVPVPADYKVRGFDLNFGVGYDLYRKNNSYFGLGFNTGVTMPFIKMKNLKKTVEMTYKILKATKTKIRTYKFGAALQGRYELENHFSLYTSADYSYQTGRLENDWFRSSVDVDGASYMIDLGLEYTLKNWGQEFSLTTGYTHKGWNVDKVEVKMLKSIYQMEISGMMDMDFDTDIFYFGIGYNF